MLQPAPRRGPPPTADALPGSARGWIYVACADTGRARVILQKCIAYIPQMCIFDYHELILQPLGLILEAQGTQGACLEASGELLEVRWGPLGVLWGPVEDPLGPQVPKLIILEVDVRPYLSPRALHLHQNRRSAQSIREADSELYHRV